MGLTNGKGIESGRIVQEFGACGPPLGNEVFAMGETVLA